MSDETPGAQAMKRIFSTLGLLIAVPVLAIVLGASSAMAGSIQRPGLTTGMAEGFGRTEGLFGASLFDLGARSTDPFTKQAVAIPIFAVWSTRWDIAGAHISFKAAPLVGVGLDAPGLSESNLYNPYASVWFSWFLGNGFNLSLGEGAHIGLKNDLTRAIGRDFTAFQQNLALSYVKDNWNVTGNAFYTSGRTRATGSQPRTFNLDLTATKRVGRKEYGGVAYGQWDLNSPSVGYLGGGRKQSEIALGGIFGYLLGNLVQVQAKFTTNVHQKNLGGYDTRLWMQVMLPLWTPRAPAPRNAR
jgi:Putative MetA-pathway of phenol degradation